MKSLHPQAQALATYLKERLGESSYAKAATEILIKQFAESDYNTYNPDNEILDGWCPADAAGAIEMMTKGKQTLSYEDSITLLEHVAHRFDANIGVAWDVLQIHAQDLKSQGGITFIPNPSYKGDSKGEPESEEDELEDL